MRNPKCAWRSGLAKVRFSAAAVAIIALTAALGCSAQVLYRWVDKDGKVNFSDKPPNAFKGEVTRIQVDSAPDLPAALPAAPRKPARVEEDEKPLDAAGKRRQVREQLAARLTAARAKVELARKVLSDGEPTDEGERQFVQERFDRNARRPERTPPPRSNCMAQSTPEGRDIWICPRSIPGEAYFSRQEKLEEALRRAEEELAEAERAYRRGVD
jgi:hypothetical protein